MKLVMKTLAVVAVCAGLVGCGERPARPKAQSLEEGQNQDTATPLSKAVVNVTTKSNLENKKLTLKVDGKTVASECAGVALSKLEGTNKGAYKLVRQECEFGVRNVFVVSEYEAPAPAKSLEFTLIAADADCSAASEKQMHVDAKLEDETKAEDAATKKSFFGYGAIMADM